MGTFKSVDQQAFLLDQIKPTQEAEYWTSAFERPPFVRKETAQITNIAFSSDVTNPTYALSSGTRVNIYGEPPEWNRTKTLNVFPLPVYGGHFRDDSRLFVCGCEDGVVRTFDMSTGAVLRQFNGHSLAVHACSFSKDGLKIGSAGDDRTVRIWDLSVGKELACFSEHSDYVRCIVPIPNDPSLWISAGYDKTVKFFDSRVSKSVRTIECSSIIEDIALDPTGFTLAVASDRSIYMWDVVAIDQKPIACLQHHHKTVTSLSYASNGAFLLSASLDKHIKVFDANDNFTVVATLDQPAPIVKMKVSPDDRFLVTAMSDCRLSISSRKQDVEKPEVLKIGRSKPSKYFKRVLANSAATELAGRAEISEGPRSNKVSIVDTTSSGYFPGCGPIPYYDKLLKKFEHTKALTCVMKDNFRRRSPEIAISLIDELARRDALRIALAGRPEKWVAKALRFAGHEYHQVAFQRVLSEFINAIVDVYGDALVGSKDSDLRKAFRYVCDTVDSEWQVKLDANELVGAVECLLNHSQSFE